MALTIQAALERWGHTVGAAKRDQHLALVRRYLLWGGTNADAKLAEYAGWLASQGYKGSTIDLHVRMIRAFWRSMGVSVPKPPTGIVVESESIALAADTIHQLIHAARQAATTREQALLAVSTVYGVRAEELARIRRQDIRIAEARIFIRTVKGGRPRWQYLPPLLHRYVDRPWPTTTANRMARYWHSTMDHTQCTIPKGIGWHSIRHALDRDLLAADVSEAAIHHFLRWATKSAGKQSMVKQYADITATVQEDGSVQRRVQDDGMEAADHAVWIAHPYLGDWSG